MTQAFLLIVDTQALAGTVRCNLKKWLEQDEYLSYIVSRRGCISRWSWDNAMLPDDISPMFRNSRLIMGLVGSPVGFASAHSTSRVLQIRIQQTMLLFKLETSGDTEVPAFILKE